MELKQLEYFMAVCRYGSLGKAAGKLYTTQPNVSKVIHQLEADLGQPLFERTSKGLRLEARQKLDRIRPKNLGQASRVSGVSPADVAVLMVYLKQRSGETPAPHDHSGGR